MIKSIMPAALIITLVAVTYFVYPLRAASIQSETRIMGSVDTGPTGPIGISHAFIRAMMPGGTVASGYITLVNKGSDVDRLIGADSFAAERIGIHEVIMKNNIMKMRPLKEGIKLPVGKQVELKPGAMHLMFMDVKEPFKKGSKVSVMLQFEKAGKIEVIFDVGPADMSLMKHEYQ